MDLNWVDASEAPVPPEEVRIQRLEAAPHPDGRRVKVEIELTPFLQRPSLEVAITDGQGDEVASTNIIEAVNPRMSFTMHVRNAGAPGPHQLHVVVYYPDGPQADDKSLSFQLG
jgi:hypothetical protein